MEKERDPTQCQAIIHGGQTFDRLAHTRANENEYYGRVLTDMADDRAFACLCLSERLYLSLFVELVDALRDLASYILV